MEYELTLYLEEAIWARPPGKSRNPLIACRRRGTISVGEQTCKTQLLIFHTARPDCGHRGGAKR